MRQNLLVYKFQSLNFYKNLGKSKRIRSGPFDELENDLAAWVKKKYDQNIDLTGPIISTKALEMTPLYEFSTPFTVADGLIGSVFVLALSYRIDMARNNLQILMPLHHFSKMQKNFSLNSNRATLTIMMRLPYSLR